jgi:hypothetical protein
MVICKYILLVIQKKIKEHSMGVITRWKVSQPFLDGGRPMIPYEERIIYRWVLHIPIQDMLGLTTDKLFLVRVESLPTMTIERHRIQGDYAVTTSRQTWNPLEIKIVNVINGTEEEHYNFLRDWMHSENNKTVSLERLDPTGYTVDTWILEGSFIREMHQEIVYDRTVGDITIRLHYNYAININ